MRSVLQVTREWLRELRDAPRELQQIADDIARLQSTDMSSVARGGSRKSWAQIQRDELAKLREEQQRALEQIPGEEGLRAVLARVEDEARAQQRVLEDLRQAYAAIPEEVERSTRRRGGINAALSERQVLMKQLRSQEEAYNETLVRREALLAAVWDIQVQAAEAEQAALREQIKADEQRARAYENIVNGLRDEIAELQGGEEAQLRERLTRMGIVEGEQMQLAVDLLRQRLKLEEQIADEKERAQAHSDWMDRTLDQYIKAEEALTKYEYHHIDYWLQLADLTDAQIERVKTLGDAMTEATSGWQADATNATLDFLTGTGDAFSRLINGMIEDLARLAIQYAVVGPLFSGMFGGAAPGVSQQTSMLNDQWSLLDSIGSWLGFASGLSYVPSDNFPALLHQGEAVIDADTMSSLRQYGIPVVSNGGAGGDPNVTIINEYHGSGNPSIESDVRRTDDGKLVIRQVIRSEIKRSIEDGSMLNMLRTRTNIQPRSQM
jgi:hypothetical protein